MKNNKRALRRFLEKNKFLNRLDKFAMTTSHFFTKSGNFILDPLRIDLLNDSPNWIKKFKNHSTVCSCSICKDEKYKRSKIKKETKKEIDQNND